ncbi:MAG TPA: hypothetical protein VNY05_42320 [Candidatus Acidoferrales bacterium]|nr:hypothetical protein [Candidatus Acidoferrales bacterium]
MSKNEFEDVLEIGTWLGRRQAFSLIAGRCSAADAKCLRELRESKKYKLLGLTWEECCKQRAGIGRSTADEIIQNLEEFGPNYFALAQLTGLSAKEYRRIRGAVSGHALLHAGEDIPIDVENAPRLVAAVEALRREASHTPAPPADAEAEAARCFAKAERAFGTGLAELDKLLLMRLDIGGRMRLQTAIGETAGKLRLLDMQVKV